jgi:SPP1 gp7 family putative phage head morphogenesis protein
MAKPKFPLHLERDYEKLFSQAITRLGKSFLPKIKKAYKSSTNITDFKIKLNELYNKQLERIGSKLLIKKVDKEIELVSAWSFSQVKKTVIGLRALTKEQIRDGILINRTDPGYLQFVDKVKGTNRELVKILGKEYIEGVTNLATDTFARGGSVQELTNDLLEYTGGDIKKAEFWARDQMGSAYGEFTKQQQTLAGIKNYIWRTVGDNAVRENHRELNGRVFSWTSGARSTGLLTKPGAAHPGEDYRCRCTAEPTLKEITK